MHSNHSSTPVSPLFLKRVLVDDEVGIGAVAMRSMVDDVEELCLVKECRELEEVFGTIFADDMLQGGHAEFVSMKEMKDKIAVCDRQRTMEKSRQKAPLIVEVEEDGGWQRLWSHASGPATHKRATSTD